VPPINPRSQFVNAENSSRIPELIQRNEVELLNGWYTEQQRDVIGQRGQISESGLKAECQEFLSLLSQAAQKGGVAEPGSPAWQPVRDFLDRLSQNRARQGFNPRQTASFIFSLKRPLFSLLVKTYGQDAATLSQEIWRTTELVDRLGLHTTEAFMRAREEVISRQQEEMLELSTPVVKLWNGILALPMIGTLDSARTQIVMESLLQRIVETGADVAIIDITGVPTVDTLVAQHLLKTVTAARLMGADCIISGIRPQIAQTIVHLGVQLGDVITKATLADAFAVALRRQGMVMTPAGAQ
jgi:rsbT co-antagonist protein RsbR